MTHFPKIINGPLQTMLRHNNLKLTNVRIVVFQALAGEPQSMHQLVSRCTGVIDRTSVYRTVKLYERLGIVQRLQIGWKYKLELNDIYRAGRHHHHHLTCSVCGTVIGVPGDTILEKRLQEVSKSRNFVMQDHQIEIQGLCPTCALKKGLDPFNQKNVENKRLIKT